MKKILFRFLIIFYIFTSIPVFIFADDEVIEDMLDENELKQTVSAPVESLNFPSINARHAILFDRASKTTIYGKNETEKCKMASTTKIMTSIIVIENCDLNSTVKISKKSAGIGGSRLGLSTNDEITVENLLYGLMLCSGNDCAVALAEYVGGNLENFSAMMNKKAIDLGLTSTNFVTPHGLDNENHFTSALDLAILTDYALNNPVFSKIVKTKTYTITINGNPRILSNTNELLGNYEGIYGVKTGFTNGANRCLVTACRRNDLDIICIVLGCDTKKYRTKDSVTLLNYAFNNYSIVNVKDTIYTEFDKWLNSGEANIEINKGTSKELELYLDSSDFKFSSIALNKSEINNISCDISFDKKHEAPIKKDSTIGTLTLKISGKEYFSIDILNNNEIYRKNIFDYFNYILKNYLPFFTFN